MLLRYFHTLRHLRPGQISWRIRRRLIQPRPDLRAAPPLRGACGPWRQHRWRAPTMLGPERFRFLNEERQLHFPDAWNDVGLDRLWLYNLHYFDDLNATATDDRQAWHRALIRRWMSENPPARGAGWESYPLSLRIVNWIKWALAGGELEAEAVHSLAVQVRQLRRQLEFHLLGNHLFENAKALVFAGLFFGAKEGAEWLKEGARLLEEQIHAQILSDGGHFELSPMYHSVILEGMLDVANLYLAFGMQLPETRRRVIWRMFDWLRVMSHPDGEIAFFNDAAFGIAPSLEQLERYAEELGFARKHFRTGSCLLSASGYARLEQAGAVVLADVAAVGPDYLPGHAHADSLSFEFSLGGQRVLVNSGTSVYGTGPERQRQRGTAAHNTVRLDGEDSSEVWSGFRVARRARVKLGRVDLGDNPQLEASHDGYTRLKGHPIHRRGWTLDAKALSVRDRIDGSGTHFFEMAYHFHPDLILESTGPEAYAVFRKDGGRVLAVQVDPNMAWQVEEGSWHPEFGVSVTNWRLRGTYRGQLPMEVETGFLW